MTSVQRPSQPLFDATLPVVGVLSGLRSALNSHSNVVLEAPPGAGKSTVVPLALLHEPWLGDRRILMLEPRRLAARAVAERMARSLNENIGETVGYRMRLDTRVGPNTRIEVITEGVLTRWLQEDPELEGVGLVIFDEFHERNLQSDLGLALLLDARSALETNLKILLMSATLDSDSLVKFLDSVARVQADGRLFPVEHRYVGDGWPLMPEDGLPHAILHCLRRALAETEGDILVFLPGAAEIRRVTMAWQDVPPQVRVLPLYGELSANEQDAALTSAPLGRRHVILATNIAETSLTLPGVRVVIDSGLVRRSRFDPATGMSRLDTVRISRSAAIQRAGRAGRLAPGVCYRLWSAGVDRSLAEHTPAEILEADLTGVALELAQWGCTIERLRWLDPPPKAMWGTATTLLQQLAITDSSGQMTALGRSVARLPVHPRLGRVLQEAKQRGCALLGAALAALLSERDPLRSAVRHQDEISESDIDILTRLQILCRQDFKGLDNSGLWRRIEQQARQLYRLLEPRAKPVSLGDCLRDTDEAAVLLASGFADRIAQQRPEARGRYLLANGRGATLARPDALSGAPYLIALEVTDREREAVIRLAIGVSENDIEKALSAQVRTTRQVVWSSQDEAVIAREQRELGSLVLSRRSIEASAGQRAALVLEAIRTMGLDCLPWTDESRQLCARIELLRVQNNEVARDWPTFSLISLKDELEQWLSPWIEGVSRRSHFPQIPLLQALKYRLGMERERVLQQLMPEYLALPTGTRVRIDYLDELAPAAAMRMQEVFGLASTPRIAGGVLPITFKLLSPASRPLQVTRDLASFWCNAYHEVRKDMRGRYPKHYWPEDPLQAEPTRRTKPRS
jgi:ATP-dependent helicase HrpB